MHGSSTLPKSERLQRGHQFRHAYEHGRKIVGRLFVLYVVDDSTEPAPPLTGGCCRFHPTCSCYAHEAVEKHGPARGVWLTVKRLGRCHPFAEGGFDPVPER